MEIETLRGPSGCAAFFTKDRISLSISCWMPYVCGGSCRRAPGPACSGVLRPLAAYSIPSFLLKLLCCIFQVLADGQMLGAGGLAFSAADALVGFAVAGGVGDKALGAQHSAHLSHGCLLGLIQRPVVLHHHHIVPQLGQAAHAGKHHKRPRVACRRVNRTRRDCLHAGR